ncbi:MAG: thioredoxin family protein [Rhodobacterales bacterium]|nr:thioredoxin family protein [Rhodobacterales bacterium]
MPALNTPVCEFGWKAQNFSLQSTSNEIVELNKARGQNGTLIMFICNHCPYVVSALDEIIFEAIELIKNDIAVIAISSNDVSTHPDDSFENMQALSVDKKLPFPYLYDETQEVAKTYDAACTPDFFGFNSELSLQYRGRLNNKRESPNEIRRELYSAMIEIAKTGKGPREQIPSMGCSIKWKL